MAGAGVQPEQPPQQQEGERGDAPSQTLLASEHEEIAAKLMAAGPGGETLRFFDQAGNAATL